MNKEVIDSICIDNSEFWGALLALEKKVTWNLEFIEWEYALSQKMGQLSEEYTNVYNNFWKNNLNIPQTEIA